MYRPFTLFAPQIAEPRDMPNDATHGPSDPQETRARSARGGGRSRPALRGFAIAKAPESADAADRSGKYPKWVRFTVLFGSALGAWALAFALISLI